MLSGGFIGALVLFVVAMTLISAGIALRRTSRGSYDDRGFLGGILLVIGIVFMVILVPTNYPYNAPYHTLEAHSGVVSKVEKRFVDSGSKSDSITREVAFWLNGEERAYISDDIRFNGLEVGDSVDLRRQLDWHYGGEDTWNATYLTVVHHSK